MHAINFNDDRFSNSYPSKYNPSNPLVFSYIKIKYLNILDALNYNDDRFFSR